MSKYYNIIQREKPNSNIDSLYYEVSMLNAIFNMVFLKQIKNVDVKDKDQDAIEKNILVESFLLHARNLIEFLDCSGHLKCSEFLNSKKEKISPIEFIPDDVIKEINEHLSHISKKRKTSRIEWNLSLLKTEINKKIGKFLDKISPDYFSSEEKITKEMFNKIIK